MDDSNELQPQDFHAEESEDADIFQLEMDGSPHANNNIHNHNNNHKMEEDNAVWEDDTRQFRISHGFSSDIGKKDSNEDRYRIVNDLDTPAGRVQFYAIYDGHCGAEIAELARQELHELLSSADSLLSDDEKHEDVSLTELLRRAFAELETSALDYCRTHGVASGSTAVVAVILARRLVVATLGDSLGVLSREGNVVQLSAVHRPGRATERARIEAANGWVVEEIELHLERLRHMHLRDPQVAGHAHNVDWTAVHRLCGELSVSRSIGDPMFKNFLPGEEVDTDFLWPENHSRIFNADLITAEPEFVQEVINAGDEFMVLACDGVWDVLSEHEAIAFVAKQFAKGDTPQQAADKLVQYSIRLGSGDNVTVIVVRFQEEEDSEDTKEATNLH